MYDKQSNQSFNRKQIHNHHQKLLVISNNFYLDFNYLACSENQLYEHLIILDYKTTINFQKQESLICLTKSIMNKIFKIKWNCPKSNLCPRIPNRINYLLWINRYLDLEKFQSHQRVKCVDIGTGATCIYPLLGTQIFPNWDFWCTQIDDKSINHAKQLIKNNNLQDRIYMIKCKADSYLHQILQNEQIDYCLCNPPFFDESQSYSPKGIMKNNQYQTSGGQYQFLFNLFRQSLHFSNKTFFTCLLGTKYGFDLSKQFLQMEQNVTIRDLRFGEIRQGKNIRYIIAWRSIAHENSDLHDKV